MGPPGHQRTPGAAAAGSDVRAVSRAEQQHATDPDPDSYSVPESDSERHGHPSRHPASDLLEASQGIADACPEPDQMTTTGRGDTIYGVTTAVLAITLVVFGVTVLLLGQRDVGQARRQLGRTVFEVSSAEQRSPRDPLVLRDVARRLPGDIRLVPASDFARTGRVLVVWRRLSRDRRGVCLVIPADRRRPISRCKARSPRGG